jgi:hypothetical protein
MSITSTQKACLRTEFSILSEACSLDQGDPSTCPLHEIRARSLKERMAWFDELSELAILNIHTHCQLCWEKKRF